MKKTLNTFQNKKKQSSKSSDVLIKCNIQDIKDYLKYLNDEKNKYKGSIWNPFSTTPKSESEHSFNEFIKDRYYTSKLAGSEFLVKDTNKYIADISFLNLESEKLDLTSGNFSNIYAIGTNFSNCKLELAKFEKSVLIGAILDETIVQLADFKGANLSYVNIGETYGTPIIENSAMNEVNGSFNQMPEFKFAQLLGINPEEYKEYAAKEYNNYKEAIIDFVDKGCDGINNAALGIKGALIGGFSGFTAANVAMATLTPLVGTAIAINLSAVGATLGAIEGTRYILGYNTSLINQLTSKIFLDQIIGNQYLEGNKVDYNNIAISDTDSEYILVEEMEINNYDKETFDILQYYNSLNTLVIESSVSVKDGIKSITAHVDAGYIDNLALTNGEIVEAESDNWSNIKDDITFEPTDTGWENILGGIKIEEIEG